MRLKSFTADSLPEAMELVRKHLGDDAVILDTYSDPDSGSVRVAAAVDTDPAISAIAGGDSGLDVFNTLSQVLDFHRVPIDLTDRLLSAAAVTGTQQPEAALAGGLESEFFFASLPQAATERPLLLVGPPGAGKTATAAKLAAQVRVRGGAATLITLDLGKAGSLAQISSFAEALGANLREAHDTDTLDKAVKGCPSGHFIVIDTIGTGPFDPHAMQELQDWIAVTDAEGILVHQASGDPLEAAETAIAYAEIGAHYMIATKLDTTRRLGSMLNAVHNAEMTLLGVGTASTIGGGLRGTGPEALAKMLLACQAQIEETAEPSEEDDEGMHVSRMFATGADS